MEEAVDKPDIIEDYTFISIISLRNLENKIPKILTNCMKIGTNLANKENYFVKAVSFSKKFFSLSENFCSCMNYIHGQLKI